MTFTERALAILKEVIRKKDEASAAVENAKVNMPGFETYSDEQKANFYIYLILNLDPGNEAAKALEAEIEKKSLREIKIVANQNSERKPSPVQPTELKSVTVPSRASHPGLASNRNSPAQMAGFEVDADIPVGAVVYREPSPRASEFASYPVSISPAQSLYFGPAYASSLAQMSPSPMSLHRPVAVAPLLQLVRVPTTPFWAVPPQHHAQPQPFGFKISAKEMELSAEERAKKGDNHIKINDYAMAYAYLKTFNPLELSDKKDQVRSFINLGICYKEHLNDQQKAIQCFNEAYDIAKVTYIVPHSIYGEISALKSSPLASTQNSSSRLGFAPHPR